MTPAQLKEARRKLGLSPSQMADRLGLEARDGPRLVRAWSDGREPIPTDIADRLRAMLSPEEPPRPTPEDLLASPEAVKEARKTLGLTQLELARALRLRGERADDDVRAWETGKRTITGPAAVAIALALRHGWPEDAARG